MGQKVNPIGIRLNLHHGWTTKVYPTKKAYGALHQKQRLVEKKVNEYLQKFDYICNKIEVDFSVSCVTVNVSAYALKTKFRWSSRKLQKNLTQNISVEKYLNQLESVLEKTLTGLPVKIKLEKIPSNNNKDLSNIVDYCKKTGGANLLAKYVSMVLSTNPNHQSTVDSVGRAFENIVEESNQTNLRGIYMQVKGRLNGADRSRRALIRLGTIPLHTLSLPLDYSYKVSETPYGILGVKVWLAYSKNNE